MTATIDYCRRYRIYAQSQGRTPEEQEAWQRSAHPGGPNGPYTLWLGQAFRAARAAVPHLFRPAGQVIDHDKLDDWLQAWVRGDAA